MVNMALSIYLPLYLQLCRAKTVGQAGVLLTAPLFGVVLGAYLSGQYMRFTGRYKLSPLVGLAVATAAFLVLAVAAGTLALAAVVGLSFLLGVGIGASLPPMMVASQNSVPAGDIGIATAVHTFFRAVGGAIGVAVFSAVVLHWGRWAASSRRRMRRRARWRATRRRRKPCTPSAYSSARAP